MSWVPQLAIVKQADGRYGLIPTSQERGESPPQISGRLQSRPGLGAASRLGSTEPQSKTAKLPSGATKGGMLAAPPRREGLLGDISPSNSVSSPSRGAAKQEGNLSVLSKLRLNQSGVLASFDSARLRTSSQPGTSRRGNAGEEQIRSRLLEVGSSFVSLDRQVEEDAKRRRELEQRRLEEVLNALAKLEQRLMDEGSNRDQDAQKLAEAADIYLRDSAAELQSKLSGRFSELARSIEALCDRCASVERGIQQFRGEVPTKLKVETNALKHKISELGFAFHADIKQRADQDGLLLKAVEEAGFELDSRMQQELTLLERRGEALQEIIDVFAAAKDSDELRQRQATVFNSLAEIRASLEAEARVRETADDHVVQAINEYTATLHRSLSAANS